MDDCSSLPGLGYAKFSDWLHKKVSGQRIPISGSLEVTMRCNLRCQHCYIPEEHRQKSPEPELSLPEIQRILDDITDAGCFWLLLTGGDPFQRRDFLDIYTYAKRKGLLLTIFTNGTLITPRIAAYLADWRPFKMEITLYGATQETYERVTGIPGSYTRCRRGIDLLLKHGLPLSLKTMAMTINYHELKGMEDLAGSLGVEFKYDAVINPAIDGSMRPAQLRLKPSEIVEIEKTDPGRASRWSKMYLEHIGKASNDRRKYLCGAGLQGFHIDAMGKLHPCISDRSHGYDLRHGYFDEAWNQHLPPILELEYIDGMPCVGCDLRLLCHQCPAVAAVEEGTESKPVFFLCDLAKARRAAFAT